MTQNYSGKTNFCKVEAVYIYFDTATYDEIERDEKVKYLLILFVY